MPYDFQLTFLGPHGNYVAIVTRTTSEGGYPDESLVRTYGLPNDFATKMKILGSKSRFYYNLRGHDFLSFSGQWRSRIGEFDVRHVETARTLITESSLMGSVHSKNHGRGFEGLNMIPTFGPLGGSVFVNATNLLHYVWENFPDSGHGVTYPGLNHELFRIICQGGYSNGGKYDKGIIQDIALNALGGWVILFNSGENFSFGGQLPFGLKTTLKFAKERRQERSTLDTTIYRLYLNHQHPEEYVLVFSNGQCYVKLHANFETQIRELLGKWAGEYRPNFDIHFTPSSTSSEGTQRALDAVYYSNRGIFFLARQNYQMALYYLRTAMDEDADNVQIRLDRCLAIIAYRGSIHPNDRDPILERMIASYRPGQPRNHHPLPKGEQDETKIFQAEYMWMLGEHVDTAALRERLTALQQPFLNNVCTLGLSGPLHEWSYEMAIFGTEESHSVLDVPDIPHELAADNPVHEVEGNGVVIAELGIQPSKEPMRKIPPEPVFEDSTSLNPKTWKAAWRSTKRKDR